METLINVPFPERGRAPSPTIGACCYGDGTCSDLTESDCADSGGLWAGADTSCSDDICPCGEGNCNPHGGGACCAYGDCSVEPNLATCLAIPGGFYLGDGTACGDYDCTTEAIGCCICPPGAGDCPGPFQCCSTTLDTGCPETCTFNRGFAGIGPAFCCGDNSSGTPCAVCFSYPPTAASHCCPTYPPLGAEQCCLFGYTCCGQGDSACCNDLTEVCCDIDSEFKYCCTSATQECCGFDGCCPIGFCIDGTCTA